MTTFLVIGVVGLAMLAFSLLAGDLLDGLFDALSADWFSSAVIGGFVSAFGFGAASAVGLGAPGPVAVPVGIVAGGVVGWFAAWLTRLVRGGGSDGTPSSEDAVGHEATVVTTIPAEGYGVVSVRVGGHTLRLNAQAEAVVEPGTGVHVTGALSPTAVTVAPNWTALDPAE